LKPTILLTCKFQNEFPDFPERHTTILMSNYITAVERGGGIPVLYPGFEPEQMASLCDGLLLTGGIDVNPKWYHRETIDPSYAYDSRLDEMEYRIFRAFYQQNKPIFGICRGIQTINVFLGGTLIQDIPTQVETKLLHNRDWRTPVSHDVHTQPGSLLSKLCGSNFRINSFHHQAVEIPGGGLRATAYSEDGIIEAVEHASKPIWGVQWHPERMVGDERPELPRMDALFQYFINQCAT